MTFADRVIAFNRQLRYTGNPLPKGIRIMHPFRESAQTLAIAEAFYQKYYRDDKPRWLILGINPGRFGAGLTGIPFTDTKRLWSVCGIAYEGKTTHEPSSVFVYEMIRAFGGAEAFYGKFYINSICPLGFTKIDEKGKEKNYNYYDNKDLLQAVHGFIIDNINTQKSLGVGADICFCFGKGKNEAILRSLNEKHGFFGEIIALEHPRFIVQYKAKSMGYYIDKYIEAFSRVGGRET